MNHKLSMIIENVLSHYFDANMVSQEARSRISQDIVQLYFSPSPMFTDNQHINEEIAKFYEERKETK